MADLSTKGIIFQIGNSPRRIDIITRISGIKFEQAYANRAAIFIEGLQILVISLDDLIINKRASGRLQDLADMENCYPLTLTRANHIEAVFMARQTAKLQSAGAA